MVRQLSTLRFMRGENEKVAFLRERGGKTSRELDEVR
jgi:hypothetical protein